jgi:hypothetical protein
LPEAFPLDQDPFLKSRGAAHEKALQKVAAIERDGLRESGDLLLGQETRALP